MRGAGGRRRGYGRYRRLGRLWLESQAFVPLWFGGLPAFRFAHICLRFLGTFNSLPLWRGFSGLGYWGGR
jgi:hypothetical protein